MMKVFDLMTDGQIASFTPLGGLGARGVAFDPTDGNIWVTTLTDGTHGDGLIHKIPPLGGAELTPIPDPGGPNGPGIGALDYDCEEHVLWAAVYRYVNGQALFYKLDPASGSVLQTWSLPGPYSGDGNDTLAIARPADLGGVKVILSDLGELRRKLFAIRTDTGAVVQTYTLPIDVTGIDVNDTTGELIAFGRTSPSSPANIDNLGLAPYTSLSSPLATGGVAEDISLEVTCRTKCCNNPTQSCITDADCGALGPCACVACGSTCVGGANAGIPCTADTQCPGGVCQSAGRFDHLKCYKIHPAHGIAGLLDLTPLQTQLPKETGCKVKGPRYFCAPVCKDIVQVKPPAAAQFAPGPQETDHLCYKIACPKPLPQPLTATDQFGSFDFPFVKAALVCTPAIKGTAATTTITTTSTTTTTTCTCPQPASFFISTDRDVGTPGSADPLWTLTGAPAGTTGGTLPRPARIIAPNAAWGSCTGPPPGGWVSANTACTNTVTDDCPAGDYTYRLCWAACGPFDVSFDLLADNSAVTVTFDGGPPLPGTSSVNFTTPTPFGISLASRGCDQQQTKHVLEIVAHNDPASASACNASCTGPETPLACCTGTGTGTCTSCGTATGIAVCGTIGGSNVQFLPCDLPPCQQAQPQGCTCGNNVSACYTSCGNPGDTCATLRQGCINLCQNYGGPGTCSFTPCTDCSGGSQQGQACE
jgi:hypothetical protein